MKADLKKWLKLKTNEVRWSSIGQYFEAFIQQFKGLYLMKWEDDVGFLWLVFSLFHCFDQRPLAGLIHCNRLFWTLLDADCSYILAFLSLSMSVPGKCEMRPTYNLISISNSCEIQIRFRRLEIKQWNLKLW